MLEQNKLKIIELFRDKKTYKVSELSEILNVSDMTIRRYLNELDEAGLVRKVHGGAVRIDKGEWMHSSVSNPDLIEAQEVIAERACQLVNDGDVVLFGSGNIVLTMAGKINKNLVGITTCIRTAMKLLEKGNNVYLCGGNIDRKYLNLYGDFAETVLKNITADKAFITAGGINERGELTEPDEREARINRLVQERAEKVYLLVESNKMGFTKLCRIGDLTSIDYFLTEQELSANWLELFENNSVSVV